MTVRTAPGAIAVGDPSEVLTGRLLSSGESTLPRELLHDVVSGTSGRMYFAFFKAAKTEVITQIRMNTWTTAAAATPTVCRMGVYSVDASTGNLTLVGATANDTALFSAATTEYVKALSASFTKLIGQWYAYAPLVVSGAAVPNWLGYSYAALGSELAYPPRLTGVLNGQTDLPSTVTAGSFTAATFAPYAALLP